MTALGVILFLLLTTVANGQQPGTSPDNTKSHEEPPISCRNGRLLGQDGAGPIGNTGSMFAKSSERSLTLTFPF